MKIAGIVMGSENRKKKVKDLLDRVNLLPSMAKPLSS
jgi:hypothetical protein